ncbi:11666_t:CDS:2, partial [Entrophospora sp. SA101]
MVYNDKKLKLSEKFLELKFMQRQEERELLEKVKKERNKVIGESQWSVIYDEIDIGSPKYDVEYLSSYLACNNMKEKGRMLFGLDESTVKLSQKKIEQENQKKGKTKIIKDLFIQQSRQERMNQQQKEKEIIILDSDDDDYAPVKKFQKIIASINQTKPLCDYGNINNHGKNYSMTNNTILTDQVANANPDDDKLYKHLTTEDFVVPKLNPLVDGGTQVKNDDYDDNSNRKRPGLITIDYLEKKLVKLNSIITQEDLLKFAHFTNTTSKYDNAAISSNRYYNNHNKSIIGIKRKNTNLKTSET